MIKLRVFIYLAKRSVLITAVRNTAINQKFLRITGLSRGNETLLQNSLKNGPSHSQI